MIAARRVVLAALLATLIHSRSHCFIDDDPCINLDLPCGPGKCTPSKDCRSFACECPPYAFGRYCEQTILKCGGRLSCHNGGTCHNTISSVYCECPAGFTGRFCQTADPNATAGVGMTPPRNTSSGDIPQKGPRCKPMTGGFGLSAQGNATLLLSNLTRIVQLYEQDKGLKFRVYEDENGVQQLYELNESGRRILQLDVVGTNFTQVETSPSARGIMVVLKAFCCADECPTADEVVQFFADPHFMEHFRPQLVFNDQPRPESHTQTLGLLAMATLVLAVVGALLHCRRTTGKTARGLYQQAIGLNFNDGKGAHAALAQDFVGEVVLKPTFLEGERRANAVKHDNLWRSLEAGVALGGEEMQFLAKSTDADGSTALHGLAKTNAVAEERAMRLAQELVELGADVDALDRAGHSALFLATITWRNTLAIRLLQLGASPLAAASARTRRPLHAAIDVGNQPLTMHLLQHDTAGQQLQARDSDGLCALMACCRENFHRPVLQQILAVVCQRDLRIRNHCADLEEPLRRSALHVAAEFGADECMRELLAFERERPDFWERRADRKKRAIPVVNEKDSMGRTPLHVAVQSRWKGAISVLLEFGANPEEPDLGMVTPRQLADRLGVGPFFDLIHTSVLRANPDLPKNGIVGKSLKPKKRRNNQDPEEANKRPCRSTPDSICSSGYASSSSPDYTHVQTTTSYQPFESPNYQSLMY